MTSALVMAAPPWPSLTITKHRSITFHPLLIKPTILRSQLSPPSHRRKNNFLPIQAIAPPYPSTTNLKNEKAESSWYPVFLTRYLDMDFPTRFNIRNRSLLISLYETNNEWVALNCDYGCESSSPEESLMYLPTIVSGGVLFVWVGENGWEGARATTLPDLRLKFIVTCRSIGYMMTITEMLPNHYKALDSMCEMPNEIPTKCCFLETAAFDFSYVDLKSAKGGSTSDRSVETAAQALEFPTKGDSTSGKSIEIVALAVETSTKGDSVIEESAIGVPKPLHIRIVNSVSQFFVKNKDLAEVVLKQALSITVAALCTILGLFFIEKSRWFQFGVLSIVFALVFCGLSILKKDNETATK